MIDLTILDVISYNDATGVNTNSGIYFSYANICKIFDVSTKEINTAIANAETKLNKKYEPVELQLEINQGDTIDTEMVLCLHVDVIHEIGLGTDENGFHQRVCGMIKDRDHKKVISDLFKYIHDGEGTEVKFRDGQLWLAVGDLCKVFNVTTQHIEKHLTDLQQEDVDGDNAYYNDNTRIFETNVVNSHGKINKVMTKFYTVRIMARLGNRITTHESMLFSEWAGERISEVINTGITVSTDVLVHRTPAYVRQCNISMNFAPAIKSIKVYVDEMTKDLKGHAHRSTATTIIRNHLYYITTDLIDDSLGSPGDIINNRFKNEINVDGVNTFGMTFWGDVRNPPKPRDIYTGLNYLEYEEIQFMQANARCLSEEYQRECKELGEITAQESFQLIKRICKNDVKMLETTKDRNRRLLDAFQAYHAETVKG